MQRQRISLDGGPNGPWQFYTDPDATLAPGSFDVQRETTRPEGRAIRVPAPWQSQGPDLRDFAGTGWYVRDLEAPAGWLRSGECAMLHFGAVDFRAEVWVNDRRVGSHEGGYLPFEMDITDALRPGTNRLEVRVQDEAEIFSEIPHGKQSWYGMLSGIWQPVWLEPASHGGSRPGMTGARASRIRTGSRNASGPTTCSARSGR